MILKILTVAGLATFEIYAAIPAGFAFKLSPWTIFFTTVTGGIIGVYVAAFLGEKIKAFLARYRKPKAVKKEAKPGLAHKLWEKYGVIGLGFVGTMTVGAPVSIAVGYGFGVSATKMVAWCCAGVLTRCALFTALGHYGLKLFGN